jgi:hypothetical protein
VGITFKLHNSIQIIPSTINVTNFAISSFTLIIVYGMIYWIWNKYFKYIHLYYGVGIVFLLDLNLKFLGVNKSFLVWMQYWNVLFDNFIKYDSFFHMLNYIYNHWHKTMQKENKMPQITKVGWHVLQKCSSWKQTLSKMGNMS